MAAASKRGRSLTTCRAGARVCSVPRTPRPRSTLGLGLAGALLEEDTRHVRSRLTSALARKSRRYAQSSGASARERIAPRLAQSIARTPFRDLWPQLGASAPLHHCGARPCGEAWATSPISRMEERAAPLPRSAFTTARIPTLPFTTDAPPTPDRSAAICPKLDLGAHVGALAMSDVGAGPDVVSMTVMGACQGRRLRPRWHQDVDYQCPECRRARRLCQTRPARARASSAAFTCLRRALPGSNVPQAGQPAWHGSKTSELVFSQLAKFTAAANVTVRSAMASTVLMSRLDYERVVLAGVTAWC